MLIAITEIVTRNTISNMLGFAGSGVPQCGQK